MKKILPIIAVMISLSGCSVLQDAPANIAGGSVRALEDARVDSVYQSYPCEMGACFDAVLTIAKDKGYYVFSKDRIRGFVVLMNIPGCVDTTEVGVFLSESLRGSGILVELSSRSSLAKKAVARILFAELAARFAKK